MKTKIKILSLALVLVLVLLPQIKLSGAYLSDDETSVVSMTAGTWSTVDLNFYSSTNKKTVGFKVYGSDLPNYTTLDYVITYDTDQTKQGIMGTRTIGGATDITENNLLLGYCTTGGTCVQFTGITKIDITITLHGSTDKILTQKISL